MEAPTKKTSENAALNRAIIALSRNIQALREFVEMIEALLQQKELQLFQDKAKHLLPIIAAAKEIMPDAFSKIVGGKGDKLRVSPSYLRRRFDLFELNCLLIAFDLWKKLSPKDELRSNSLMEISYDRLVAKSWQVAEGLSRFLAGEKALPETYQLVGKFNYWQSVKRQNRWQEIKEEVEQEEIDSKSARFRLAWYSLTEKKDEFFKLLPSVLKSKEISHEELISWPIFEDIRSDERYKTISAKKTKISKQIKKK